MKKSVKYFIFYIKYVVFRHKTAKDPRVNYSIPYETCNIYHTGGGTHETIQTKMDPGPAKVSV